MKASHLIILLLALPLMAAAPLRCAGVTSPGLAYPAASGQWIGSELDLCHRAAAALGRSASFTPILMSADRTSAGGADLLFVPAATVPAGFRRQRLLADDYLAILVPAGSDVRSAAGLAGQPICIEPGSAEDAALVGYFKAHHWRLNEFVFQEVDEMHDAYMAGRCDGIVGAVSLLRGLRGNAGNRHFGDRILPDHLAANPIVIATRAAEPKLAAAVRE